MSNPFTSEPHDPQEPIPVDTEPALDSEPARPSQLDYEADPLLRLERNNKSTRQAIMFFIGIILASTLSALLIYLVSQLMGGPLCDADDSAMLCNDTFRWLFAIVPTGIAIFGLFGSVWITYAKWRDRLRWRPWIAVVWFILPYTLAWVISVGSSLMIR